jgi:hypothetical protein
MHYRRDFAAAPARTGNSVSRIYKLIVTDTSPLITLAPAAAHSASQPANRIESQGRKQFFLEKKNQKTFTP